MREGARLGARGGGGIEEVSSAGGGGGISVDECGIRDGVASPLGGAGGRVGSRCPAGLTSADVLLSPSRSFSRSPGLSRSLPPSRSSRCRSSKGRPLQTLGLDHERERYRPVSRLLSHDLDRPRGGPPLVLSPYDEGPSGVYERSSRPRPARNDVP